MAKDDLIDDRVSLKQCQQAVDALFAHVSKFTAKKAETQLLPDAEQSFWLTIALKKQPERSRLKVFSIPVTYPVVDPRKESVCLITKDPQRTYKDLIEDNKIHFIHKVIGIKKLKGKYKAYDARRALMKEHGLFLADDRVIPLLPKLLGSKFFAAKKQPLPVNITRKDLKKELERAVSSTYMPSIRGTALSIKVGRMSQSASQVIANIKTALPAIAARVNDGWDNIQSLGLKTSNSATLPIWTCSLNDSPGGRWAGLTAKDEEESESEGETDEDEEEVDSDEIDEDEEEPLDSNDINEVVDMDGDDAERDSPVLVQTTKPKGKKRAADTDEDDEVIENLNKKKKSKQSPDETNLSASAHKANPVISPKSKKSTPIVPTKVPSTPLSTTKDALAAFKSKAKKAPVSEAPTPTNTPANTKKAGVPVEKSPLKNKSADVAAAIDPDSSAPKKKKKKEEKKAAANVSGNTIDPASTTVTPSVITSPAPAKRSKNILVSKVAAADHFVVASGKSISTATKNVTVEVKAKQVESAAIVSEETKGGSQKKKEKKETKTAPPAEVLQKTSAPEVEKEEETSKKKKEKKAKSSNEDAPATGMTEATVAVTKKDDEKKEKKEKKKGKKLIVAAASTPKDDAMVVDTIPATDESEKKPRKDKKSTVGDKEKPPIVLNKEELKQKKSEAPGEKKKKKVLKAKGGRSAKEMLLGRKVV